MMEENLVQLGVTQETAEKTEMLGKCIISKGYFWLNEETAKLYGDAFVRASERLEFQNIPINMTGQQFINNFKTIPMQILPGNKDDQEYTKLPSEMSVKKQGIFSKLINYFKEKFTRSKPLLLGDGNVYTQENSTNTPNQGIIERVKLSPEQLKTYYEEISNKNNRNINEIYSNGQDNENYK